MTVVKKSEDIIMKDEIVKEIVAINNGRAGDAQLRPNMAILMIGYDDQSNDFIESLEKEAVRIGVDTHTYKCPMDSDDEEIRAMIDCLNDDELMDGIYLQLPLPEKFNEEEIKALISTDKDLNYLLNIEDESTGMKEAKLFRGVLENFKNKNKEEL